jgi:hypothetical protein
LARQQVTIAMPNAPNNDNGGTKSPVQLGGHEVQYVLVASLIGAILLLILLVVLIQY